MTDPRVCDVDVRSAHDYGPAADRDYEDERRDSLYAGPRVIWDIDPGADTVTVFKVSDPDVPLVFRHGDAADAEPAPPGGRLKVDGIFG